MVVLLTKKQAAARVGLAAEYLMTLARKGKFPQPIKYGEHRTASVRFVESEVDAWIAERMAERDATPMSTAEG